MADIKEKKESLISQYRKLNPEEQKYIRGICWKVVISFVVALAVAIWLDFFSGETRFLIFLSVFVGSLIGLSKGDSEEESDEEAREKYLARLRARKSKKAAEDEDEDDDLEDEDDDLEERLPTGWNWRDELVMTGQRFEGREAFLRTHQKEINGANEIDLIREPDNRYDKNAVACSWKGTKIGYIPSGSAQFLAPALDNGMQITARCNVWTSPDNEVLRVYLWITEKSAKDKVMLEEVRRQIMEYSD